jgi:hypothetical protein
VSLRLNKDVPEVTNTISSDTQKLQATTIVHENSHSEQTPNPLAVGIVRLIIWVIEIIGTAIGFVLGCLLGGWLMGFKITISKKDE